MVLSCPIEHSPISYDPLHNPRPMRPVHFPLVAGHHPSSLAKEIFCFLDSGCTYECKNGHNHCQSLCLYPRATLNVKKNLLHVTWFPLLSSNMIVLLRYFIYSIRKNSVPVPLFIPPLWISSYSHAVSGAGKSGPPGYMGWKITAFWQKLFIWHMYKWEHPYHTVTS